MKEREFGVICDQSLCKSSSIFTENYTVDRDEDNYPYCDTSDIDFLEEYTRQHMTPLNLIDILKTILKEHPNLIPNQNWLIKECEDWEDIETTVIEE